MTTTDDGVWPERAETVDDPAALTVFGVDRDDDGLATALRAKTPPEADALVVDRPASPPSRGERARGYLHNPALLGWRALRLARTALAFDGDARRDRDLQAAKAVADDRGLPVVAVGRDPVAAAPDRSAAWRVAGWVAALVVLAGIGAVVARPHFGTGLFLATALALLAAYLLAYSGAAIRSDVDRLFGRLRRVVDDEGYQHPVAVVAASRRPGLVDRAKSARIRTRGADLGAAAGDV